MFLYIHSYIFIYRKSFQPRDRWINMTPMYLGLFVKIKKLQPKVISTGNGLIFAYFVVEAKNKNKPTTLML